MTETEFTEFIDAICGRPRIYTPTGAFYEVVSFLEGYGTGIGVGNLAAHSIFSQFREWVLRKYYPDKSRIDWINIRERFDTDEEALIGLPLLYREYLDTL